MLSGDKARIHEEAGKDLREVSVLGELAESVAKKIDENRDHPEAVRVLKEIGNELMAKIHAIPFEPIPDWRIALAEKFRI